MIKIGISPCPNDIFIFGHLIQKNVEWDGPELSFEYLDIQALNEAVLSPDSDFDLIKCSYAILPKLEDRFELFDVGGALGKGVGPLLVGQSGLELENRTEIYVPGFDTTAYRLFEKYGPKGVNVKALRYDLLMEELGRREDIAGVIIHESRFTYESMGLSCLLDLGKAWEENTGLPLPLGGPVLSKSMAPDLKDRLQEAIKKSLVKAWEDREPIESLLKQHAQEMDLDVMASHIDLYVNDYSLNLGKEGRTAIKILCS